MALNRTEKLSLESIRNKMGVDSKYVLDAKRTGFNKNLEEIYADYQSCMLELEQVRTEMLSILNDRLKEQVHSIRGRIKDRDHLIEKILRNVYKNPEKYEGIDVGNYQKIVTDLIGFRIIILDKRDWRGVHNKLLTIFRNDPGRYVIAPKDIILNYDKYENEAIKAQQKKQELKYSYLAEKPIVYITSRDDEAIYKDQNLNIENSKTHYRSIHYIVRYGKVYFEIQVRTLFEEGWLEFDHRVRYPYDGDNKRKQEYIRILNSLASSADQLISFYDKRDFRRGGTNKSKTKDDDSEKKKRNRPKRDGIESELIELF